MKKTIVTMFSLLLAILFVSCETITTATTVSTTATTAATTTSTTTQPTTTTVPTTTTEDIVDPLILGANDQVIFQGDVWDPMEGVSAIDDVDGIITSEIDVTGTYDVNVVGYYTITYTVSDAAGNEATTSITLRVKAVELSGFNIVNGDFSEVLELPWGHWAGDGGASSATIVDGVLNYVVTAIGNLTYSNQFSQTGRTVENGKIYQLTFLAKADDPRPMIIMLEDPGNGYLKYFQTTIDLTTDWVTYSMYIVVTGPTTSTGKLGFFLGRIGTTSVPTTVYMDDVVITELTEAPDDITAPVLTGVDAYVVELGNVFDPLYGVTVTDDLDSTLTLDDIVITGTVDPDTLGVYNLTYSVTDAGGNTAMVNRQVTVSDVPPASTWIIPNGDFSVDAAELADNRISDNWGWHANTGQMTGKVTGGTAVINIINVGSVEYGVQFYLLNRVIEHGRTYEITFRMRADAARNVSLVLENGVGGTRMFDNDYSITTEWQTFTFTYYHAGATITAGKFAFFAGYFEGLGSAVTTVYLDDVAVTPVTTSPDTEAPVLTGVEDTLVVIGDVFDPLLGVTVTDARDASLTVSDIVLTGLDLFDPNVEGEYLITYTVTDASGNETSIVRKVTVAIGVGESSLVLANGDFTKDQLVPYPQPATAGWGWHGSGQFDITISGGVAKIDVYDTWNLYYGVQFYQQNRILTQGQVYRISFLAKADAPRPIQLSIEPTASAFVSYFDLTTEWTLYTYEFEMTAATITNGKFAFFVGNVHGLSAATTVWLDDVKVERIQRLGDDETAPQIWGTESTAIVLGADFDPMFGLRVYDHRDKTLLPENVVVVSNNVDTATAGDYEVVYELTDASGNKVTVNRLVRVIAPEDAVDNRIQFIDGDFALSSPITNQDSNVGWTLKISGSGAFDPAIFEDGHVKINVTALGTVPHGVQFFQRNGFTAEAGGIYRLTFRAKADAARNIRVSFEETMAFTVLQYNIVAVGTEWADYEVYLYNYLGGEKDVKVGFFLGLVDPESVVTAFYFDDVAVDLVGYIIDEAAPRLSAPTAIVAKDAVFNPLTGIKYGDLQKNVSIAVSSATEGLVTYNAETKVYAVNTATAGTYVLVYTLVDSFGNELVQERTLVVTDGSETGTFGILNGDFAVDQLTPMAQPATTGWGWHGNGSFLVSITEGVAKLDVYDDWNLFYGVQFYMQNRTVTQGEIYRITFRAKADAPRPIQMQLEPVASGFTTYFDLTTDWVTYTYEFAMTAATITNGKFAFFVGDINGESVPTTVYLDDIAITRIFAKGADTTAPQIWGTGEMNLLQGTAFDPLFGLRVYDHYDKSLKASDIVVVSNDVDPMTPGTYHVVYTLADSSRNTATVTRTVNVVAAEDMADNRIEFIDGDFALEAPITNQDTNLGWTLKISGTGAFANQAFEDGYYKFTVTNVGTVPHGIQFFQRNGFVAEANGLYLLTFRAKADEARDIRVSFEETNNFTVIQFNIVSLSTEWATYEVLLYNYLGSLNDVKIGFFTGLIDSTQPARSALTTVYFDDVSVELVGYRVDATGPRIYAPDASVVQNATFDPLAGIKYGDAARTPALAITSTTEGFITYNAETKTYTVNTATVGSYVLVYTLTDHYGNVTVEERTVTVTEPV
ncbi:MAG: immunoglobulin-like domain-containing protein [Candidatus Izemoplasmatales bacterium]